VKGDIYNELESFISTAMCTGIDFMLAITVLTGCCSQQTAMKNDEQIQVTDLSGREVKIKAPVNKVVLQWSGSGGGFITMIALERKNVH